MGIVITERSLGVIVADASTVKDIQLAKTLTGLLDKTYPGYVWFVDVNSNQGLINVKNLFLSGKMGFRIDMAKIYSISQLEKDLIMAGGELLERFDLARKWFNDAKYAELPVDFKGDLRFHRG
jgi:hypothetical protein